jgi:tetratricopeptide (TPR) repeat protein
LRRLREALKAAPNRRDLALALARCYIQLGRGNADPRYYGHAEAVLAPWLASPNPDPETLVLRATVLQNRHAFQPALADLDAALRQNPRLAQAWLSRAAILEVQGDYPGALRACLAVARAAASLAGAVCLESALSLSGQAESAYQRLSARVAVARANPDELAWARLILGELAERLGRSATAESWYRMAARTDTRSIYLLSTYADFLLDRDRPEEVVELLEGETRADPLLLRLTLAERRLNHPRHAEHLAALRARFEASRARGDTSHQGDEARYALYLAGDAELALRLASANWAVQREPRDARILLEAAREAGRPEAGRAVAEFLARTRLEDVRLQNLLSHGGGPHS